MPKNALRRGAAGPENGKVVQCAPQKWRKWRRRRQGKIIGAAGAEKCKNSMFRGKYFPKGASGNANSRPRPRWPRWSHTDYYFFDLGKHEHIQTTTFFGGFSPGSAPPWEVELAPAPAYAKEGVGTDRSRKQGVRPSKNLARKWSFWQRGVLCAPPRI